MLEKMKMMGEMKKMLNQFVIVGRVQDLKREQEKNIIIVEVSRPFKNENGTYENDLLIIEAVKELFDNMQEYRKIGDLIGVKGRIQSNNTLIAERITFLASKGV